MNDYLVSRKKRFAVHIALFMAAALAAWATVRGLIWIFALLMLLGVAGCQHTPISSDQRNLRAQYMLNRTHESANRPATHPAFHEGIDAMPVQLLGHVLPIKTVSCDPLKKADLIR